jgi:hypothetical protein
MAIFGQSAHSITLNQVQKHQPLAGCPSGGGHPGPEAGLCSSSPPTSPAGTVMLLSFLQVREIQIGRTLCCVSHSSSVTWGQSQGPCGVAVSVKTLTSSVGSMQCAHECCLCLSQALGVSPQPAVSGSYFRTTRTMPGML